MIACSVAKYIGYPAKAIGKVVNQESHKPRAGVRLALHLKGVRLVFLSINLG